MEKKKVIIVCLGIVVILGTYIGFKTLYSKSELLAKVSLFEDFEESSLLDKSKEETLCLKDIEDEKKVVVSSDKIKAVVVNNPVVEIKETKNEISKEEVLQRTENQNKIEKENKIVDEVAQSVVETEKTNFNVKTEKFVKLVKNESVVANMQAMMFALLPTDWFFSNSKVVIDSDGIDENTEYVTFDKVNQELLKNRKSGDIKIFAYDEIWNNGTSDYVRKTRCYIR